jgi:nucleoside-diphosphate-sugar epimerase
MYNPPKGKILITGANGFVGSNLYEALSGKYHLAGIDITGPGKYPAEDFFNWDDLDRLPPADAIIHLAGKAHDTSGTGQEKEYFDINLGLTRQIFDYFLQSSTAKFIFFSSVKAVADSVPGEILTEDTPMEPRTVYGRSKQAAEQYIIRRFREWGNEEEKERTEHYALSPEPRGARERGREGAKERESKSNQVISNPKSKIQNPKSVYILRPAMIHGPGNKGNLNLLFETVRKGLPWPLGAFENQRSFASIGNVSFVIQQILEKEVPGGIYNLADDETVSTNEIIRLIAFSHGRNPRIWKIPKGLICRTARLGDLLHFPLNSERLNKLIENFRVSNSGIKSALEIESMPVRAVEGLSLTFGSFKRKPN